MADFNIAILSLEYHKKQLHLWHKSHLTFPVV